MNVEVENPIIRVSGGGNAALRGCVLGGSLDVFEVSKLRRTFRIQGGMEVSVNKKTFSYSLTF